MCTLFFTLCAVFRTSGTISFGLAPSVTARVTGSTQLAVIRFRAIAAGVTSISGSVQTLASLGTSANLNGLPIGSATPRQFVAGLVDVVVSSTRHARDQTQHAHDLTKSSVVPHIVNRRQSACAQPPCQTCGSTARANGDANGDCAFGISDVSYIQLYLSESVDGFSTSRGSALQASLLSFQLSEMDANNDSTISAADSRYLARVFIGKLTFLREPSVRPVQDPFSQGRVTINITELDGFGRAPSASIISRVFVDVAHSSPLTQTGFNNPNLGVGRLALANKGQGQYGFVAEMQRIGPLYENGQTTVQPSRCLPVSPPSTNCSLGVFVGTRFAYDGTERTCAPVIPGGCLEAPPNFASILECTNACEGLVKHSVAFTTEVVPADLGLSEDIGFSFLAVTLSDESASATVLSSVFLKSVEQPPLYPTALNTVVPSSTTGGGSYSVPLLAVLGYSPMFTLDNRAASNATANVASPQFAAEYRANVNEGTPNGTRIVTVVATDADLSAPNVFGFISYSLRGPSVVFLSSENLWQDGPFTLNGTNGVITLVNSLDYEAESFYDLEVSVSDNQPPFPRTNTTIVHVSVIDTNDNSPEFSCIFPFVPCVPGFYTSAMPHNAPIGTVVGHVQATDADNSTSAGGTNNQLAFNLATTGVNVQRIFDINSAGGVFVNQAVNQPEGLVFTLSATVSDLGLPARSAPGPATVYVAMVNDSNMVTVTVPMPLATFVRYVFHHFSFFFVLYWI